MKNTQENQQNTIRYHFRRDAEKKKHLFLYFGIWLLLFFGVIFCINRYISRSLEESTGISDAFSACFLVSLFSDSPNYLIQIEAAGGNKYWMDISGLAEGEGDYELSMMQPDGQGNVFLTMDVYQKNEKSRTELWICNPKEKRCRKPFFYEYKEGSRQETCFFPSSGGILEVVFSPSSDEENQRTEKEEQVFRFLLSEEEPEKRTALPDLWMTLNTTMEYYVTEDQGIWYMDRYGNGYHCGEDGENRIIFKNDGSLITTHNIEMYPNRNGFYFYNVDSQKDYRVNQDGVLEELSRPELQALRKEGWQMDVVYWDDQDRAAAALIREDGPGKMAILVPGKETVFISPDSLPLGMWLKLGIPLGILAALLAAGILGFVLAAVKWHHRAAVIPVTFQIASAAFFILLAGGFAVRTRIQSLFYEKQMEAEKKGLMQAAFLEAGETDEICFIKEPVDVNYFEDRIVQNDRKSQNARLCYYQVKEEEIYPVFEYNVVTTPARLLITESEWELVKQCVENREMACGLFTDEQIPYLGAYAPVFLENGKVAGVVSYCLDTRVPKEQARVSARRLNRQIFFYLVVLLMTVMALVHLSLCPLKQLKGFLKSVEKNELPGHLPVKGNNEITSMISVFNRMSENIREYMEQVQQLRNRYEPFAPKELVEFLGKKDIRQVRPGDQALLRASLALIDMADFQAVRESTGEEELFRRINQSLQVMIPIVKEKGGQILSFYQGGMTVFFPGQGTVAVSCMMQILDELKNRGCGVYHGGMDYREIRLEVAGNEERMDFTVGQEEWQEVKEMQKYSATHGLGLIAGSGLIRKMEEEGDRRLNRFLGKAPHWEEKSELYEILPEENQEQFRLCMETAEDFEGGVREYLQGNFRESRECFAKILRKNRYDKAAQMYFTACDQKL